MASTTDYDLVVVGSGFAGCMATLSFLEECSKNGKQGKVALVEVGREGERSGASKWTMAYLRLDKDLNFDDDWVKEMRLVSEGLADEEYCHKLAREAPIAVKYLQEHGVKFVHHDEPNVLLEFKTAQHFVFPEGGGKAIISNLFDHIRGYKNCDILYQTEAIKLLTDDSGAIKGLKVRKTDGLLHDLIAPNVVLACGGFEGEWRRMKTRRLC
jgi:succinate dehydrogenase/fumarate reductase flavoprotein subunit